MLCSHVAKRCAGQHNPATGLEEHGVELDPAFVAVLASLSGDLSILDGICAFSAWFETEWVHEAGRVGVHMHVEWQDNRTSPQRLSRLPLRCRAITCSTSCILPASSAIWVWATCTSIFLIGRPFRVPDACRLAVAKHGAPGKASGKDRLCVPSQRFSCFPAPRPALSDSRGPTAGPPKLPRS